MNPDIGLILAFLHTREPLDALATPEGLADWLAARGLPPNSLPTSEDVSEARHLRAALGEVIRRGESAWGDERTRQTFDGVTLGSTLRIAVGNGSVPDLRATDGDARGGLASIVAAFYRINIRDEIRRLKGCDGCGYAYFYDVSKNNSRRWCDMAICGSQQKSRAYRRRQSAEAHRHA